MNGSYLELASDIVTAMISKGQVRVPQDKGEDWKSFNLKVVYTVGWALQEMYREVMPTPQMARQPQITQGIRRIIPVR